MEPTPATATATAAATATHAPDATVRGAGRLRWTFGGSAAGASLVLTTAFGLGAARS